MLPPEAHILSAMPDEHRVQLAELRQPSTSKSGRSNRTQGQFQGVVVALVDSFMMSAAMEPGLLAWPGN
jgi:hypothetical protein